VIHQREEELKNMSREMNVGIQEKAQQQTAELQEKNRTLKEKLS
jgi:hypothetical protein